MNEKHHSGTSRREFLKNTGRLAAAATALGVAIPRVHAAEDNTIRIALVGCGGRGTGAIKNALAAAGDPPVKLVAMADVFPKRMNESCSALSDEYGEKFDVPDEQKFIGFDAYQKAMDCLRPGDIVILATPPAFRWVHFTHAIDKGLNVFMEKPLTVDGPTSRKMLDLGKQAEAKNLKVAVGLMCRHCLARKDLHDRIRDGQIGDILLMRAYRMEGPVGFFASKPKPDDISELMYQVQRFHSFLWASGGCYSDFFIHNIDECCWMKDAWPVQAKALGGRHYRGSNIDQNFDHYSVEYIFADGARLLLEGRNITGCYDEFASYAHGSKGSAVISTSAHNPAKCRIYKSQRINEKSDLAWEYPQPEKNPYDLEWVDFLAAIREGRPYNEVQRGVEASLVASMGRMAAHTGKVVTYDEILNCDHEFAPDVDKLAMDSPAPLQLGDDGKYPVPQPGIVTKREY